MQFINKSLSGLNEKFNRFELITKENGREYVNMGNFGYICYDIQDNGNTLKIFVDRFGESVKEIDSLAIYRESLNLINELVKEIKNTKDDFTNLKCLVEKMRLNSQNVSNYLRENEMYPNKAVIAYFDFVKYSDKMLNDEELKHIPDWQKLRKIENSIWNADNFTDGMNLLSYKYYLHGLINVTGE